MRRGEKIVGIRRNRGRGREQEVSEKETGGREEEEGRSALNLAHRDYEKRKRSAENTRMSPIP